MDSQETGRIESAAETEKPPGFVEAVRSILDIRFRRVLNPLIGLLRRWGVKPNQVTMVELLLNLIAVGFVLQDWLPAAGIVFLFAGIFDVVDGSLARLTKQETPFGAFLDSTLDRVSEGLIFAAIAYRFAVDGHVVSVACVVIALIGSMLTSYTRARAEALSLICKVGIASRTERVILITAGLILNLLQVVVYLLAFLTTLTVIQRIVHVHRQIRTK